MGHVRHHAIVVTSWDERRIREAHKRAPNPTQPVESTVNGYWTFLVAPDGSKSGWGESDTGDEERAKFKAWLREREQEDAGLEWVEVEYGLDDGAARVSDSRWKRGES